MTMTTLRLYPKADMSWLDGKETSGAENIKITYRVPSIRKHWTRLFAATGCMNGGPLTFSYKGGEIYAPVDTRLMLSPHAYRDGSEWVVRVTLVPWNPFVDVPAKDELRSCLGVRLLWKFLRWFNRTIRGRHESV